MSDERRIAVVTDYDQLIAAFRARADELNVTREGLDAVTGLQSGYVGKLLAPVPMKSLGRVSLGPMLQAMGLAIVLVEDPEALRRFAAQHTEKRHPMPSVGTHEVVTVQITRGKLKRLARRGGKARAQKMTPKQRSKAAQKAARALWRKRRRQERAKRARLAAKSSQAALAEPCANQSQPPNSSRADEKRRPLPQLQTATPHREPAI